MSCVHVPQGQSKRIIYFGIFDYSTVCAQVSTPETAVHTPFLPSLLPTLNFRHSSTFVMSNVPSCHLPTGHFCFLPHFQRVLFLCFFIVHLHSPSLHLPPAPRGSNNAKSQHNDKWSDGNCGAGNAKFPPLATNVASISSFVYVSNTAMGTKRSAVNQM